MLRRIGHICTRSLTFVNLAFGVSVIFKHPKSLWHLVVCYENTISLVVVGVSCQEVGSQFLVLLLWPQLRSHLPFGHEFGRISEFIHLPCQGGAVTLVHTGTNFFPGFRPSINFRPLVTYGAVPFYSCLVFQDEIPLSFIVCLPSPGCNTDCLWLPPAATFLSCGFEHSG